jgi:N utilization substance protein A
MSQSDQFVSAIKQIAAERGIEVEQVVVAIKKAIEAGFGNDYPEEFAESLDVDIDMEAGRIAVYADKKVVDDVTHPPTQISLVDAKKIDARLKANDHILVEITHTGDFGRIAAQAARQVISQFVREAEKEAILQQFKDKIGTVDSAVVQRMDREGNVLLEINRATAKMPPEEQVHAEFYRSSDRIKVLLKEIQQDDRGKILVVSRSDPNFLKELFAMEVPEIASGTVEIMAIAREAGARSKMAVKSNSQGVDPIGSCVGQRGARINAVTNELKGTRGEEKIDIIPWDDDTATFISNSIRPATAAEVKIINEDSRQALILVEDDDLSLAIGREGQNVRLAAKLTGWHLDIQGTKGFVENGSMSAFEREDKGMPPLESKKREVPKNEFEKLKLSTRIERALQKADIKTIEELKGKLDSGEAIPGLGVKSLEELKAAL